MNLRQVFFLNYLAQWTGTNKYSTLTGFETLSEYAF